MSSSAMPERVGADLPDTYEVDLLTEVRDAWRSDNTRPDPISRDQVLQFLEEQIDSLPERDRVIRPVIDRLLDTNDEMMSRATTVDFLTGCVISAYEELARQREAAYAAKHGHDTGDVYTMDVRDGWVDSKLDLMPREVGITLVPEYQERFYIWLTRR